MGRLLSPSSAASRRTSTKLEKAVRVKLCVRMKPTRSFARGCGDRALARSGLAVGRMAHFSRSMTDFYSNAQWEGCHSRIPKARGLTATTESVPGSKPGAVSADPPTSCREVTTLLAEFYSQRRLDRSMVGWGE